MRVVRDAPCLPKCILDSASNNRGGSQAVDLVLIQICEVLCVAFEATSVMTGGLIAGAAVGTLFQEGAKPVKGCLSRALKYKPTQRNLASTVGRTIPVVQEMRRFDEGDQETSRLLEGLQEAENVANKHLNAPLWKCCCWPRYQGELQGAYDAVVRSLTLVMQSVIARDTRETLSLVRNLHGKQFKGLFKAPVTPDLTVGLDVPFKKLKRQLLQSGASVFVLTGLAGSGKTTLASLLCWDQQVRDKFGENILFVTVSKNPDLKTIVHTLFQHCGSDVPDLRGERTVRQLKNLLAEIGQSPMMLVLDDVWEGSESLIDAFMVPHLKDYKVLVTSRVNLPRFEYSCRLEPLCLEDSVKLFRHFALPDDATSSIIHEELIRKVARSCWGSPLAIEVIARSLCGQPPVVWKRIEMELSKGRSILDSDYDDLLKRLQKCLDDVLESKPIIKDCFMDLGLFPEDHKIPVAALIDMWIELYEDVNDDIGAIYVHDLTNRHLAKLVDGSNRKAAADMDMCYNKHFLMQHDLLRDLAIRECNQEPFEQRKRLVIDLSGNNRPEWWQGQNQQGVVSCMLSFFPKRWILKDQKQVVARTLCISTDETFTSDWSNMLRPNEAEVLVLNIRSSKYSLPEFTEIMSKLKVLIATNYGFHPSELNNFELLGSLPDMKRIRLENLLVPRLGKLRNLQKLSLYMCNTRQAFESGSIQISDALPNLEVMNIDYCNDLEELPSALCNIATLKKLSITSCHKLSALPREIGNLENLELLRLSSCTELLEIPESVGRLQKLSCLDISDCLKLNQLPTDIGDLLSLKELHMWGCSSLSGLQQLVDKLQHLQHELHVICDEDVVALWEAFTSSPNLKIDTFKADVSLGWLHVVSS